MNATLGEIKLYCEEHNIKIKIAKYQKKLELYGNPLTEAYFNYYAEHCTEINKWLAEKKKSNSLKPE